MSIWKDEESFGDVPKGIGGYTITTINSHEFILFGGIKTKGILSNETYRYNMETRTWRKLNRIYIIKYSNW